MRRQAAGLSQQDLAEAMRVSSSRMSRLERGVSPVLPFEQDVIERLLPSLKTVIDRLTA